MSTTSQPQPLFIMDDVKLLFDEITTPETGVKFDPPARATPGTIQSNINPIVWTWADEPSRLAQTVVPGDLWKSGLQIDTNTLYRLIGVAPAVWQPVQPSTTPSWTWPNLSARNAQPVTPGDVGKLGIQTDINTIYQLVSAAPAVWQSVANPTNTSSPFELSTGAADADSYHDFYRLEIAFQDVWAELLDANVQTTGEKMYAQWDALMDQSADFDDTGGLDREKTFSLSSSNEINGLDELNNFIDDLRVQLGIGSGASSTESEITQLKNDLTLTLQGCEMLLRELNRVGVHDGTGSTTFNGDENNSNWLDNDTSDNNPLNDFAAFPPGTKRRDVFTSILNDLQSSASAKQDPLFKELATLLGKLDAALKEAYRFDVFAPESINYGLLLNYRQHWHPQSYQVGNLVATIPLAPQETRRYTTKTVVKKARNVKEIDDAVRGGKSEASESWRADAEIVDRAKNQTNFQKNVSGSFGNDNLYKVSAGLQQGTDQAVESAQTKREFHELVVKAAQDYRNEHRMEITTEESREDETTSYREIRNPNDELTVTYLFYELQRRYLVDEALHKVTPVVLVANDVPAPHDVDQAWILRYDWIIKRTILDDSFLPALDYLAANYAGEEVTLQVLELAVEQEKAVVDRISQQVKVANQALDAATVGVEQAEAQDVRDKQAAETMSFIKGIFDPLGIGQSGSGHGDGNSDRARIDYAKESLNRAQAKVVQLLSDLKTETTALQVAIDKYTTAAIKHFSMLADIERLRIHVKDNIIYYMQAIWTYEPSDQRYFRLCNIDVPVFTHNTTVTLTPPRGLALLDTSRTTLGVSFPHSLVLEPTLKLHQVADLERLIGFKGNYMIFPMVNFNYMTWYMMQDYLHLDDTTGVTVQDPDPLGGLSIDQMRNAMATVYAKDPPSFARKQTVTFPDGTSTTVSKQDIFEEIMNRLLSSQNPEMVIVPSNSLYIEALPGTHPLLEDFKLIHRALDVKKVQAEARHAELENLRLAARLSNGELGDPDIDKVIVVGNGPNVTVDAGQ